MEPQSDETWVQGNPQQSSGGIILSGLLFVKNPHNLTKYNIKSILSVATQQQLQQLQLPKSINHKVIDIEDDMCQNIQQYLDDSYYWIEKAIQIGNIVIHCRQGISRSPTILAAYLIKKHKWKSQQALKYVQSKRTITDPNQGFVEQLKLYQLKLNIH